MQIQESISSSVPNPVSDPVLEPVPEPSPGLPPVKNTYARIIKLPKLLDSFGHRLAEYRALFVLLFFFNYLFCHFQSVIKGGRWYGTQLFCVNFLIYFRGDCLVIFVWAYLVKKKKIVKVVLFNKSILFLGQSVFRMAKYRTKGM